jgi:uncharacterized membrane protein YdbT with pleckstrin-like domain
MSVPGSELRAAVPESTLWRGTPSQVINLSQYVVWGLIFIVLLVAAVVLLKSMQDVSGALVLLVVVVLAIPWIVAAWKWLIVANLQYELTTQRLRIRSGVFNKHLEELELYRVRDYRLEQPWFLRLFSLATLILQTADKSTPSVVLRAIPRGDILREQMRTYVEEARMRRGVREVDLDGVGP